MTDRDRDRDRKRSEGKRGERREGENREWRGRREKFQNEIRMRRLGSLHTHSYCSFERPSGPACGLPSTHGVGRRGERKDDQIASSSRNNSTSHTS